MAGKFGIKKYLTGTGVIESEVDIFQDTKIRLVVASAGATNEIAIYGRIGGQSSWSLVGSIIGSGTKDFTVSLFDFVRLECITYDSLGARVDLSGSGFQLTSGIPTIGVPGGEITDVDNLQFTSSDNSISFTAIAPSTIDIVANPASNLANNQLSNLISPTSVNQDLLPDTTNIRSLGSPLKKWEDLHVGTNITLDNGSQSVVHTVAVADNKIVSNAQLTVQTTVGDLVLNSAGDISASTNEIKNVVDPTTAQSAATKNYVDTGLALKINNSEKGAANGVATLDAGQKVPLDQLPNSIMEYKGVYNASTNTPTLADGAGNPDTAIGDVYKVSVAGTQDFGSGPITFVVGDYVILNHIKVWEQAHAGGDSVNSVNGQAGIVVLDTDDVNEGVTNLYFTNERAQDAVGTILTDSAKIDFTYDDTANTISATIVANSIVNGDIAANAAIDATKISNGVVSNTEFDYLDGVTSAIQTQLNGKANTTLNNLGSTAFNADLLPDTANTKDVGSTALPLAEVHTNRLVTHDTINDPGIEKLSIGYNGALGNSIYSKNENLQILSGDPVGASAPLNVRTLLDSTDNSGNIIIRTEETISLPNRGYVRISGSELDFQYTLRDSGLRLLNATAGISNNILSEGFTALANTIVFTSAFPLNTDRGAELTISIQNTGNRHSAVITKQIAYNYVAGTVVENNSGIYTDPSVSSDIELQVVVLGVGQLELQYKNNNLIDTYEVKTIIKKF